MKPLLTVVLFSLCISCIPIKIAPNMEEGKVVNARKFKKQLPNQNAYIFEDPKDANEFYHYINAKYQIAYSDEDGNLPVTIEDKNYFLTFYEVDRHSQTINLIPILIDAALEDKGHDKVLEDAAVTRTKGAWYIALTVRDNVYKDGLDEDYDQFEEVHSYVKHLKAEYLSTKEYIEVYLRSK